MFFPRRKRQRSLHSNYKKRIRKPPLHSIPQVGFECLEQRIVLSVDPSLVVLSTTQVDALSSGLTSFAQRLTESQAADMLASSAAGIGQPLGTVISFGDELRTSLTDPLATALSGPLDVDAIETAIQGAVSFASFLSNVTVTASSATNASGQDVLWLELNVTGSETLPDFELDLGQAGIDGASGLLLAQKLSVGSVAVDLETTLEADFSIGLTLAEGLSANEMVCIKSDSIKVGAEASFSAGAAITGVDARFGAIRLGDDGGANVTGALSLGVNIDLQEGSDGCLSLGALNTDVLSNIFTQTDISTEFDVSIPFELDIAGFDESGHELEIGIGSSDLLDASSLQMTLPTIHISETPFDFEKLSEFSINDIGAFLDDLGLWIPNVGSGFELPLIDSDISDLFGSEFELDFGTLFDSLKNPEGEWSFTTIQQLDDFFIDSFTASIGLNWSPIANAIEWTLPLSYSFSTSADLESGELIPGNLPLSVAANGEATFTLAAGLSITAGVAITSSANVNPVENTTLLSELNGGLGLTSGMLVAGDDLQFNLRDGTVVSVDLDSLEVANGTASIGDLLTLVNNDIDASGNLTLSLDASALVATDLTTPTSDSSTFSVAGPSVNVSIGNTTSVETSLAPIALGLLVLPTVESTIQGSSLESFSPRDRLYIQEGELSSLTLAVAADLEGGAALGPLSLSVYCGTAEGNAAVSMNLVDPGVGAADDGRIYLSEMDADIVSLFDYTVSAPTLDGIFQLRVTPEEIETALDIDFGDYVDYCGAAALPTVPDTTLVPYLELDADISGEGWSFSIDPSQKLSSVLAGLSEFSLDDLPSMLSSFRSYLEGSGLWEFEIPWFDVSFGEIFEFADIFEGMPAFDLGELLGRPTYSEIDDTVQWPDFSLGDLGTDFSNAIELALPDLSGLSCFPDLQRLSWALDDLIVEWEGWTPGDVTSDLDFLGRLRAWFSQAVLVFPEVLPELPTFSAHGKDFGLQFGRLLSLPQFAWNSDPSAFNTSLDLTWLTALDPSALSFAGLDFGGLESLGFEFGQLFVPQASGGYLPDGISLPAGFSVSLTPSLTTLDLGGQALALDLAVTLASAEYQKSLDSIDISSGVALDVTASGDLTMVFTGSMQGRVLVDLGSGSVSFDSSASSINLEASIDTGSGLILAANLGGLAGVSLGKVTDEAWVRLSDGSVVGAGPAPAATFSVTGDGTASATAVFEAYLPFYVELLSTEVYAGAMDLEATLALNPSTDFSINFSYDGSGTDDGDGGEYTSIIDVLSHPGAFFSIDGWIDGAAQLVGLMRTTLANDLVSGLPLINKVDVSENGLLGQLEGFFETVGSYNSAAELDVWLAEKLQNDLSYTSLELKPAADAAINEDSYFYTFYTRSSSSGTLVELDKADETAFEELLTGDTELIVDLWLASVTSTTLGSQDIDFGVDSLGLKIEGDASIDFTTTFVLDIGLGAGLSRGFFIETDDDDEFTTQFDVTMPDELFLGFGPLVFSYDRTAGQPELEAALSVDLGSESYGLSNLTDLFQNTTIAGSVRSEIGADLSASIFGSGGPGIGISLAMGFNDTAAPGGTAVDVSALNAEKFFFEITDTYIDLGGLLSGPVGEIFSTVDAMIEPLRPVLDLLTSEIPVLSDISKMVGGGGITVLDAIRTMGNGDYDGAVDFIEAVDGVAGTISSLASVSGTSKVSLGRIQAPSSTADKAAFLGASSSTTAEGLIQTFEAVASGDIVVSPTDNHPESGDSSVADAYSSVSSGEFTFPIFDDPTGVLVDLLFGGNPTLVHWDMPDLVAGFSLSQSFPIFPPLFAKFFGGFEFATDFSLGYDTRGIRQAMEGGLSASKVASKILNGVFLGDVDSGGHDKPELTFTATIGAGAELNVVVAKAGVDAGVRGTLGANLKDNNDDGKVHLDELVTNLRSGPECIFDLEGSVDAFFEAFIKVGLSTPFGFLTLWGDRFELVNETLYDWNFVTCPPVEPDIASLDGTTLVLHSGPLATQVLPGETKDDDEEFSVQYDSASNQYVVTAYDFEERFSFASVNQIEFDAGLGNDSIEIGSLVTIPVLGYGGPGNDNLIGGSGPNVLYGDAGAVAGTEGSDKLKGRQSDDTFYGGGKNDVLVGYGGSDTLSGDAGADQLIGDDEAGDLSEAPDGFGLGAPGADTITGGDDGDTILAGEGDDVIQGENGSDTIDAGSGHDYVEGGEGNDKIYGRAGNDQIWGEDAAGLLTDGDVNVNADLIEGGEGYNTIYGGPGYDIIYATSEPDGVTGSSGLTQPYEGSISFLSGNFSSFVDGGDGADTIYGTDGRDYLVGGFQADYIETGDGGDFVNAGPGNDAVIVTAGNAEIYLGDGSDVVDGGSGDNWIEGGPGHDKVFARRGSDTVYGGSTSRSYELRQIDEAIGAIIDPLHGGFSAVVAAETCEPEISFHPEVYPSTPNQLTGRIFVDRNANGIFDGGEQDAPDDEFWKLAVATSSWTHVYEAEQPGGQFVVPVEPSLPDGFMRLIVTGLPTGWIATTPIINSVTLPSTGSLDLGFYKLGNVSGNVRKQVGQNEQQPADGKTVFLDANGDGEFDATEQSVNTNAQGKYGFSNVSPGEYGVFVVPQSSCDVVSPRPSFVTVTSGASVEVAPITIAMNNSPVVEHVFLGSDETGAMVWQPVPDGPEQTQPLQPDHPIDHIAVDFCAAGLASISAGFELVSLDSSEKETPVGLEYDSAVGNRVVFVVGSKSQPVALQTGNYELRIGDTTIRDLNGELLDGEWINPSAVNPTGSYYVSGDGIAGGDFAFQFSVRAPEVHGVSMASGLSSASASAVVTTSTIEGSVWWHDPDDATLERTASEQGVNGQKVTVLGQNTGISRSAITADIDLNGNGLISANEIGRYQFTELPEDTYTVSQDPANPWVQKTPGGRMTAQDLIAATYSITTNKSTFSVIDVTAQTATPITGATFGEFAVWDVAAIGNGSVYATGASLLSAGAGVVTPLGQGGLWRVDLDSGSVVDLGPVLGGEVVVSLDVLDHQRLVGLTASGMLVTYATASSSWLSHGLIRDSRQPRQYYPVGDIAVVSANEIYAILDIEQPSTSGVSTSQVLGRIDLTVAGGNTVTLQEYKKSPNPINRLVGLEIDHAGNLIALDDMNDLWSLSTTGPATPITAGGLNGLSTFQTGGLSNMPSELIRDDSMLDFIIELGLGETVDIGFGDEPDYEYLPDGDDWIDGGCGTEADELHGDDGSDLNWWIVSEGGNDRIRGRGGDDTIYGGLQGDYLYGDAGIDTITGGASEPNRIEGGDDDDMLTGGADRDIALGQAGNDVIATLGGNDAVIGGADDDRLSGGDGDDMMIGGDGGDEVVGNAGNDVLFVVDVSLGAEFSEQPWSGGISDSYDGGAGEDLIVVNDDIDVTLTNINLQMSAYGSHTVRNIEVAHLTGGASANTIDAAGFSGPTIIRGNGEDDVLRGGSDTDVIEGGDGNDAITANAGNDTITGGAGTNTLTGGGDNDTYLFTDITATDTVLESAAGGNDRLDLTAVSSDLTLAVGNGTETQALVIEKQSGLLTVKVTDDEVETIQLGAGDDDLRIKDGGSTIASIDAGNGTDLVSYQGGYQAWSAWSSNIAVDLEAGTATGFGGLVNVENAEGGDADDTLRGTEWSNALSGNAGNDTLEGRAGNDTYYFADVASKDQVNDPSGVDTLDFTEFSSSLTLAVGDGSEPAPIVVVGGAGAFEAKVLSDTIESILLGDGNDVLQMKAGSSTAATVDAGGGSDAVTYQGGYGSWSAWSSAVTVNLDSGIATGFAGILNVEDAHGGDGADTLLGSSGNNALWGFIGDDSIEGFAGDDTLVGGIGADSLAGGLDNDTYVFTDIFGNDVIIENPGEGSSDSMNFSAVSVALEVELGSVSVSDGISTATHSGDNIEEVVGGSADDDFVMTSPSVIFPGTLDGGGGSNTLWYDDPTASIVSDVELSLTPNIQSAINFDAVSAIEWLENESLSGPVKLGRDYDFDSYINPATPVTYFAGVAKTDFLGGSFNLLEAETVDSNNFVYARMEAYGRLVKFPANASWTLHLAGLSSAETPVLVKPGDDSQTDAGLRLPIEVNGLISLRRDVAGILYIDNGTALRVVTKNGDGANQTIEPGYRVIGAEIIGGVSYILLHDKFFNGMAWVLNSSWEWSSSTTFIDGSAEGLQAEIDFNLDINLDGSIGS